MEKQHNQKTANLWFLKYKKAVLLKKRDTKSFCKIMKELASAPAFPLKDLALIQSYELCFYPEELQFKPESFPEWLRFRLAEAFYKRRKAFKNPDQTLEAATYLAENTPYKDLKISYLKHALSLAKDNEREQTVEQLNNLLYKTAPRFKPNPAGAGDYFLLAEDLRQSRKFKKAIAFYIKTLNSPAAGFNEKNLSFKGLDHIYRIQKNNRKKITNFRQWTKWLLNENTEQSLTMYYSGRLALARQEWNRDKNKKAIRILTDVLSEPQSVFVREKALYLRGLIYVQEGENSLSLKDWDQAIETLAGEKKKPGLLAKILWKKSWLLRRQKEYKKSLRSLNFLEKINKNPYTEYKVLFWKGKTLKDLGRSFLAKRTFKQLIKKDYFGYYGLLARRILNRKPVFEKNKEYYSETIFSTDKKSENLIHWLVLFNESNLLSRFLDMQKIHFLNQTQQKEEDWLKMLSLWIKAKKYLKVFQSPEKMESKIKEEFFKKHIQLFFPVDFTELVEAASSKWGVPKALVFAIIRQESAFNVRARSTADAFGLMQLIPSTARQTARKHKISYRNYRDLYRPPKNVLLGTAHLKSLLTRYNNSFVFSVAAYNAGGVPVKQWMENAKNMSTLEFIEDIPYEETRTYLRLVIRNYVFYHNELEVGGHWFPDWLLQ